MMLDDEQGTLSNDVSSGTQGPSLTLRPFLAAYLCQLMDSIQPF
jgi:hypothetical protein